MAGNLREQNWHALDKKGFEWACGSAIKELKELQAPMQELQRLMAFETLETEKDFQKKNQEMALLVKKLETNLELEQKKSASKILGLDFLPRENTYNEQFSSLQHQAATVLLQTN